MNKDKFYDVRDAMAIDTAGGYYCRHVSAMTSEELHSKSDIAAELGWRDMQIADLQRKVEALAAENKKLIDCANFYRIGFKPVKGAFGVEYRPTEALLDDCGNIAIDAVKAQSTDAELAEIRAQGVDGAIETIIVHMNHQHVAVKEALHILKTYSEQLRKESGK